MTLSQGRTADKLLFALFVGMYVAGLGVSYLDKSERIGRPDIGWVMDGTTVAPTRWDAADAGLRGGGRAEEINGVSIAGARSITLDILPKLRTQIGDLNTITLRQPGGRLVTVSIPVRAWTWDDVLFAEGATLAVGALFAIVGIGTFMLRPYRDTSWALLILCCASGGLVSNLFIQIGPQDIVKAAYFRLMVGFVCFATFHCALAMPVLHPVLVRRPRVVLLLYAGALLLAAFQFTGWLNDWPGPFAYSGLVDNLLLLLGLVLLTGRCTLLSFSARDPLIRQRARILLIGALVGIGPFIGASFLRNSLGWLVLDPRLAVWPIVLFLIALGHITLREELLNSRIAVQRALIYAAVVGLLTIVAIVLVAMRPYAVAFLILPLLYWWPQFNAALDRRLYPKRARFPEIVRAIGDELIACTSIDAALAVMAAAPGRLCDARSGVAFLLSDSGEAEKVAATGLRVAPEPPLSAETLVQVLRSLRKEILRDRLAIDPHYANVAQECFAGFDRLGAQVLMPILADGRVAGGLALGERLTGDVYEAAEIDALATVCQQGWQVAQRIAAAEHLRRRELEFADLKRFFPPQVIDQVMARGGASELRHQRKLVTVLFADLRGFTSFADGTEPEEVMSTLAEYHEAVGQRIAALGGTLERFAGDGLMVFFNDPIEQPDHVERAVRLALAMREQVERLRQHWLRKGYQIDVGMGIHTGYATCGFVGYEGRRDYAVIGTVTNLAARLSDAAEGGTILVSARLQAALPPTYLLEALGEVSLKGFHQAQSVFRLLGVA
jgi:class 3 adenylate cyclase